MAKARNTFAINTLERVCIVGVGLLGGSIGLALRAAGFRGRRIGVARRASTLRKAREFDAVDEATRDVQAAVRGADVVVLCTPLHSFPALLGQIGGYLSAGTLVTDVGSAKAEVVHTAERLLPRSIRFVGSHPMAGSEKTGVEFSRADLFHAATCLITPTRRTDAAAVNWVRGFWQALGGRPVVLSPAEHDELLARVSHLPHAVAAALVHLAGSAIDLGGPGLADSTRIASGDPEMWADIFRANARSTIRAIDALVRELNRVRGQLKRGDVAAVGRWLAATKLARDRWIARRYRKRVLPS